MPRTARKKSKTGIYHIILRGINRQTIFVDDEDNEKFLQTLIDCKEISGFELYGYCLMGNHAHILLKEKEENLEQIFKRIGSRYVYWYNWKYNRCGHLFQDRFKSEPVEDDGYFVAVLRYIHQNPLNAGMSTSIDNYRWSSYKAYIEKTRTIDYEFALGIINEKNYISFMSEEGKEKCLEIGNKRLQDIELMELIEAKYNVKAIMIQSEPRTKIEQILREVLKIDGVSTRQLSRVTGISVNIIWRLNV